MNGKRMRGRILVASALLAIVVGACGSSAATTAPGASTGGGGGTSSPVPAATASSGAEASVQPAGNDPIAALANLSSYKISFVMASVGVTGGIATMGNIAMAGTVLVKPDPAADITMTIGGGAPGASGASPAAGLKMHVIEKDGKSWNDASGVMTLDTNPSSTSLVDSLSPGKLLAGMGSYTSQMKTVGDEQKNGVATTHLQADDATLSAAASALSVLGMTNGKWTWDVWVAKDGGYAVSYVMKGTGDTGSTMAITMDLTDVNGSSNTVTTP